MKKMRLAAAVTIAVLLIAVVVKQATTRPEVDPSDLESTAVEVPLKPNQTLPGNIGFSRRSIMTIQAPVGVVFTFDSAPGLSLISMDVGSIDEVRELEYRLNGKSLGFAPKAQGWLIGGFSKVLPPALLKRQGNRLELVHRTSEGASGSWGVRYVRLRHFPAPEPDSETARQRLEMAKGRLRSRRVHPRNLPAAMRLFRTAALLTYSFEPRPPSFQDALQRYISAHSELTSEFRRSFLTAQKTSQLEGKPAACRVLDATVNRFTDKEDWRYQRAVETRRKECSGGLR
jgi:hypothetical protein